MKRELLESKYIKNKNFGVFGLGKTGFALLEFLSKFNKKVYAFDSRDKEIFENDLKSYNNINFIFGNEIYKDYDECLKNIDIMIVSPGISLENDLIKACFKKGIDVIGEIEFAGSLINNKIIGITGTNGKTTTTTLVGEIFKNSKFDSRVCGNIGIPLISNIYDLGEEVLIIELSSFQLETIKDFKVNFSAITNITPDHLDRHHSMNNYINEKKKIYKNSDSNDYLILNYDDSNTKELGLDSETNKLYFSRKNILKNGAYIKDGFIKINISNKEIDIIQLKDIKLLGEHNLENIMVAVLIAYINNIDISIIRDSIINFKGVSHRLEFVDNINGVDFINDSKGTNVESTLKAIESMDKETSILLGGYDKKSDFESLVKKVKEKGFNAYVFGETKFKLESEFKKNNYKNYYLSDDLKEALLKAYNNRVSNSNILLSPACASWDQFKSYEQRGDYFKEIVKKIKDDLNE